jgi:hypothetical protein
VFVDDRLKNLDAASRLGFRTFHFAPFAPQGIGEHRVVAGFEQLGEEIGKDDTQR